jgi:hypothetical protein
VLVIAVPYDQAGVPYKLALIVDRPDICTAARTVEVIRGKVPRSGRL